MLKCLHELSVNSDQGSMHCFFLPKIYAIIYIYNTLQRRHHVVIVTGCILEESAIPNEFTELALTISGGRLFHKVMQ